MQEKYQDNCFIRDSSKINFKKYATIFGGLFLLGICLGSAPLIFKAMLSKKIGLKSGSEMRDVYAKSPVPRYFKIYLFNLTNKDEVTNGARPMVEEIGPFVFEEWKEKFNMTDDEENDTLTFNMKSTLIFRSDLTKGLTMHDLITTVHPLIMGIALTVNVDRKPMLTLASKAIEAIFHHPKDPFWTGRIKDYLFDGIEIDCTSNVVAAKAVCSIFKAGQVKAIEPLREDFFKFSVFGALNGSDIGIYKVYRGIRNYSDVGRVISFNNKTEMEVWEGDECNQYKGTDGTIFPMGRRKEDGLWAYEPNLCISIGANYEGDSNYRGIPTMRYGVDFGDATKNERLQCFCSDPPKTGCPRRGTLNLFQCVEAPVILSLPHFYNADPSLLTQIQSGLTPNETEHAFYIDYDQITGMEMNAAKRLQFNLDVVSIKEVECMKNLPEVVMPLFWVEESAPLNSTSSGVMLKYQLFLVLIIIQWLAIVIGAAGVMSLGYIYFTNRNGTITINKVEKKIYHKAASADNNVAIHY